MTRFETAEGIALRAEFDQAWAAARQGIRPAPASPYPPVTAEEARERMSRYVCGTDSSIESYVMCQAWTEALDEIAGFVARLAADNNAAQAPSPPPSVFQPPRTEHDMPPVTSRPVFICGGDITPGPRDTDCPDPLHDWPLPTGYSDAAEEAGSRLNRGWKNSRCRRCGFYGWSPGQLRERDVRQPAPGL